MTILVDQGTRVLVQGITGRQGSLHTEEMLRYGTKVVAGVSPGKGGGRVHGVPVYDTVAEAVEAHPDINASIIFVPARYAPDAVYEAVDAGIPLVVVITEGIPVHETLLMVNYATRRGSTIIGPNTPGVISVGKCKVGIMPGHLFKPGRIGIVSRSGTLTYEVALRLAEAGFGVSTAVGIGGDPVTGLSFWDVYEMFQRDPETDAVVLVGEIGGTREEEFARAYAVRRGKPVVAYIAGRYAPPGRRMGHAGAIAFGARGTYEGKVEELSRAGVPVAGSLREIPALLTRALREAGSG
ncbi:MAG: succinate--CoA ligase subunit alpha [Thermofilaceae archaeon]